MNERLIAAAKALFGPDSANAPATQATGELSLRYIPRPTPAPDVSETKCLEVAPAGATCDTPRFPPIIGDRVRIRSVAGISGAGLCGTIIDHWYSHGIVVVRLDSGITNAWPVHALEPVDTKSLLPCPDPVTAVPRPGPDTLIDRTYRRELLCFPV